STSLCHDTAPPQLYTLSLHDALPISFEAETGHAVHVRRNDHAVPMDRRALAQRIADMQRNRIPLSPSQQGRGQLPVHDCRDTRRSEEHTSELQSRENLVCRLLLEKKK